MKTTPAHRLRMVPALLGITLLTSATSLIAQDNNAIPRAVPVNPAQPLTPPAVPFQEATPIPAAAPTSSPAPTTSPDGSGDGEIRIAPAQSAGQKTPEETLFDLANGLYSRKNYEYAAAEYEKLLARYSGGPLRQPAMFRLAECYRVLGRQEQALDLYERILFNYQQGEFIGPSAFRLATLYFNAGNAKAALPLFRKAARLTKTKEIQLAARYYEAKSLEQLERNVETMEVYRDIVTVEKDNPYLEASRRAFANKALDFGRLTDALEQYEALMQESDKPAVKAESALQAALIAQQLNRTDKAISHYETALGSGSLGDALPTAQTGYFQLLLKTGNVVKLLDEYEKRADQITQGAKPEVLLAVANVYKQKEDYAKAAEIYGQIREEFPGTQATDDAQFQELVALFYRGDDNLDSKIDDFLATNPTEKRAAQARLIQAESHFKKGEWREAGAIYASLLDAELPSRQRAELLFKLGWCYAKIENYERVTEVLTEFVQNHPDHPLMASALAQRALAYQELKQLDEALLDFTKLLGNHPEAKEREVALQQKALLLGQQRDNGGMIQYFQKLLEEYPKTAAAPQANYWTGWAYFENKEFADAIPYLEKARELSPDDYGERASLRIVLSNFYNENLPALAREVDAYRNAGYSQTLPLEVFRYLGSQQLEAGESEAAEKYLSIALERSGDDPELTLSLARVQMENEQYAKAVESIKKYLELTEEPIRKSQAMLLLSEAQLAAGQLAEARATAETVLENQPQGRLNAEARIRLGEIAMANKSYDDAAKSFLSVAVLYEDVRLTPKALDSAIQAFEQVGNSAEIERLQKELRQRYPDYEREE